MQFKILLTLKINHSYYQNGIDSIGISTLADTMELFHRGQLIQKIHKGVLYVLVKVDETGNPIVDLAGETLRFGVQLLNLFFSNFTDFTLSSSHYLYSNTTVPDQLDQPVLVKLVGRQFSTTLTQPDRPVIVNLRGSSGQIIHHQTIDTLEHDATLSYDLSGQRSGAYSLEEQYPTTIITTPYYFDPELQQSRAFGIVEITIDTKFYTTAPELTIAFQAKQETLKYYIVAHRYSEAELNQLTITDTGFTEENRPEINFSPVFPAAFTAEDLSPDLLETSHTKVVLFKSQAPVRRQEQARRNIQLLRNGDVLIPHLPQPAASQTTADLIIHLSKP
ncbi:hypothetical protein [Pantanalinema sp. GBBB05]|uniref:hypothetical protein n=1 Tax=Pantanalinema sp. GBBB05 TaxID=2604139 RepID=UPI001D5A69A8|nr:hypothetical protein [Pantanalinema sp. GBBB05]